jgi:hypothetical protein
MGVKIGHASKDERGKSTGGRAGDQNGKEVCIINWYNGKWDFVARPKRKEVAEAIAFNCETLCADPDVGYDQGGRNTLREEARKVDFQLDRIETPCESDCSAFVGVCVEAAGIRIPEGNGPTTRTLRRVLEATGEFEILTAEKYLTSDKYLRRGDIPCREGYHTVMVLEDGVNAEKQDVPELGVATIHCSVRLPVLVRGSTGAAVEMLQTLLKARGYNLGKYGPNRDGIDGDFGGATENALESFQEDMELDPNGKCDSTSWTALITM